MKHEPNTKRNPIRFGMWEIAPNIESTDPRLYFCEEAKEMCKEIHNEIMATPL